MNLATAGLIALWAAILACAVSVVASVILRPRFARRAVMVGTLMATASTLVLTYALITGDFSLDYVIRTTSLATPLPYRIAALWGAMEGSLLFYSALTLAFGTVAMARTPTSIRDGAGPVVAAVGGALLLLTALMANPFLAVDVPAIDGDGLIAILQHPAMVYHPPILYLGLTSLLVPFAVTVASLWQKQIDRDWVVITRRWMLVSWTLLTFGMVFGANWAYIELGWGGFWAWDPVENTSLMPWLAATVFIHTSRVQLRHKRLARWNVGFAALPFVLTVLGVYLTRSGVTGSVHAFAESDSIGTVLLTLFGVLVAVVGWLALRAPKGASWDDIDLATRDSWLAGQGGLVGLVLLVVLIGSAYPAYISVFTGAKTSVDPTFFVSLILPLSFLLVVGLALAMRTAWSGKTRDLGEGARALLGATAVSVLLVGFGFGWSPTWGTLLLTLALGAAALLVIDLTVRRPSRRQLVGYLAHLGMALVVVGAAGSSLGDEFRGVMAPGEAVEVGNYEIRLNAISTGEEDRFIYVVADVELLKSGDLVANMSPQIRAYEDQELPVPEPVLRSSPFSDVVVAVSTVDPEASRVGISVFVRPLVFWVWVGGLLIGLAGLVGLLGRGGGGATPRRRARGELPGRAATSGG